jgi:N-acetylglutamate synthase-like GNAT family acetyltransferase
MTRTIRKAEKEDVFLLARLIRESFATVADRFGLTPENCPRHPSNCAPDWVSESMERGAVFYVMEAGGEPSGCIAVERVSREVCQLRRLAVLPGCRGQGMGSELVQHALSEAQRLGAERAELAAMAEDVELIGWYERLGFSLFKTQRFEHLPFTVAFMRREL